MRSATICSAIGDLTLLASTQFAVAAGAGGTGVVATIPSSIVRARCVPVANPVSGIITGWTSLMSVLTQDKMEPRRGRATTLLKWRGASSKSRPEVFLLSKDPQSGAAT